MWARPRWPGLNPVAAMSGSSAPPELPLPAAAVLDPGCVVDLGDGSRPIPLWHDPERWAQERRQQFPGSDRFWQLCQAIHSSNWAFAGKDPIVPPLPLGSRQRSAPLACPRSLRAC